MSYLFTSESVSEGHPDKVCDFIADSVLDAYLEQDPKSRVACEVLCKGRDVVLAGEINSNALVDHEMVARRAIRSIGYTYDEHGNRGVSEYLVVRSSLTDLAEMPPRRMTFEL